MKNFGARIVQIETQAVVALSRDDLAALFINIGNGGPFEEETPRIVSDIATYGLREGKRACQEAGRDSCAMTKTTHMLKQNGVQSKDGESDAQISYRCSACIDLVGLNAAASVTAVDIRGTVNKKA